MINRKMLHASHLFYQVKERYRLPLDCADIYEPVLDMAKIKPSVQHIVSSGFVVPDMPDVVINVERELKSRFCNISTLVEIIEKNSVIAGDILAFVNSKSFQNQLRHKIEIRNIAQCIELVGTERLYRLVLSSAIKNIENQGTLFRTVIDYSFLVAQACVEIAGYTRIISLETAYLYGLFMDGGKVFIAAKYNDFYQKVFEQSLTHPKTALNREIMHLKGCRHDYLGVAVAKKWGIGSHQDNEILYAEDMAILLAIQEQHAPNAYCIKDDFVRVLVAIGRLARCIVGEVVLNTYQSQETNDYLNSAKDVLMISDELMSLIRQNIAKLKA